MIQKVRKPQNWKAPFTHTQTHTQTQMYKLHTQKKPNTEFTQVLFICLLVTLSRSYSCRETFQTVSPSSMPS